jgi:hypothetical protein
VAYFAKYAVTLPSARKRGTRFPNQRQATLGLRCFTRQRLRVTPDASFHERWHYLEDRDELEHCSANRAAHAQWPAHRKESRGALPWIQ